MQSSGVLREARSCPLLVVMSRSGNNPSSATQRFYNVVILLNGGRNWSKSLRNSRHQLLFACPFQCRANFGMVPKSMFCVFIWWLINLSQARLALAEMANNARSVMDPAVMDPAVAVRASRLKATRFLDSVMPLLTHVFTLFILQAVAPRLIAEHLVVVKVLFAATIPTWLMAERSAAVHLKLRDLVLVIIAAAIAATIVAAIPAWLMALSVAVVQLKLRDLVLVNIAAAIAAPIVAAIPAWLMAVSVADVHLKLGFNVFVL